MSTWSNRALQASGRSVSFYIQGSARVSSERKSIVKWHLPIPHVDPHAWWGKRDVEDRMVKTVDRSIARCWEDEPEEGFEQGKNPLNGIHGGWASPAASSASTVWVTQRSHEDKAGTGR